jgi:NADH-quinone oxidoreductase subunit N
VSAPYLDYAALAPEIVLTGVIVLVMVADLIFEDRSRWRTSTLAGLGTLGSLIPVLWLAANGHDRSMFGGAYMVDNYALLLKAFFLVVAYVTILVSADYIEAGDFYRGEYYFLLLSATLGMTVMASARDLVSIFVALETISLPTFLLAGWRKHDSKSNEAALKYFLFGVLSSAVMLYGMSLIYGLTGTTLLSRIGSHLIASSGAKPLLFTAIFLTLVGFAFKVSAVPFHFWAPDTYEGSPTPVTAFLSVASKAGGFVALINIIYFGFFNRSDAWQPIIWALAAASMTIGNLIAIRQTNIVRMLAYSSIAQSGFMLVPFAVVGDNPAARTSAFEATIIYLLIYAAMNLGAFAVVIAVARKTRSGEISSYAGMFSYAPGLTVLMSAFLFSLAGIFPFGGWFAKFVMFRAVIDAGTPSAVILGIIAGVNAVIALFYYAAIAAQMWFKPGPEDSSPVRMPVALGTGLGLSALVVVAVGVYPQLFARLGELATLTK